MYSYPLARRNSASFVRGRNTMRNAGARSCNVWCCSPHVLNALIGARVADFPTCRIGFIKPPVSDNKTQGMVIPSDDTILGTSNAQPIVRRTAASQYQAYLRPAKGRPLLQSRREVQAYDGTLPLHWASHNIIRARCYTPIQVQSDQVALRSDAHQCDIS